MRIVLINLLMIIIIPLSTIYSQSIGIDKVGTTSFQFLKVIPEARITGMGDAGVSIADNSDAVFWNPANLIYINGFSSSFSVVDWFLDVKQFSFSAAYNLNDFGTIGFHAMVNDIGTIEVTRVSSLYRDEQGNFNPGITGETIRPNSQVYGLSFAKSLTDKFSFGLTAKYAYENLVVKSTGALMFDGGVLYNTGFKSIIVAASLRNFGPEVKYYDKSYPLPQTFAIGISTYIVSDNQPFLASSSDHAVLVAANLSQPRDYSQQYQVGFEYSFRKIFFLRGGYKFNYDEEGVSVGLGLNYSGYKIDYSFNDYGDLLGDVHRFTISFSTN
jgi:hypothetical protein